MARISCRAGPFRGKASAVLDLRFPTALQIMQSLVLAERGGTRPVSSVEFARGLRANPTLIRKLLTTLVRDGLLRSQLGRGGGVLLARPAAEISLRQIYEAAVGEKPMWTARPDLPHRCVVSGNFERYFAALAAKADQAVLDLLDGVSLTDSFDTLVAMETERGRRGHGVTPRKATPAIAITSGGG